MDKEEDFMLTWFENNGPKYHNFSLYTGNLKPHAKYEVIVREIKESEQSKKKWRR